MTFPQIVRPWQSPAVSPPQIMPPALSSAVVPLVKLAIGRIGATRTFHASFSASTTVYEVKQPKEVTTDDGGS